MNVTHARGCMFSIRASELTHRKGRCAIGQAGLWTLPLTCSGCRGVKMCSGASGFSFTCYLLISTDTIQLLAPPHYDVDPQLWCTFIFGLDNLEPFLRNSSFSLQGTLENLSDPTIGFFKAREISNFLHFAQSSVIVSLVLLCFLHQSSSCS